MAIYTKRMPFPLYVLGMNKDKNESYMLGWPEPNLLNLLNNGGEIDKTLVNRIMSVLTSGKCTNYSLCYRPFEKYKSLVNDTNLVFGITKNEKFDFWNVTRLIIKYNWHFIVGLAPDKKILIKEIEKLIGIYGVKHNNKVMSIFNFSGENLCRDL